MEPAKKPQFFEIMRERALTLQKESRQATIEKTRELIIKLKEISQQKSELEEKPKEFEEEFASMSFTKNKSNIQKKLGYLSSQFQYPEFMFSMSKDICARDWYVLAKPDGLRSFLVANEGNSYVIDRNGWIKYKFQSPLPGGSKETQLKKLTILDCIFVEASKIFFIMDLVVYKDNPHSNDSLETRLFLIDSQIIPLFHSFMSEHSFYKINYMPCTVENLKKAYIEENGWLKDGIMFAHREGSYNFGVNPLSLLWKDKNCSLYPLDTDKNGIVEPYSSAVLMRVGNNLVTEDGHVLLKNLTDLNKKKKYFKVNIKELMLEEDLTIEADVHKFSLITDSIKACVKSYVIEKPSPRKYADTLSRILFQYFMRKNPLLYEDIENQLINNEEKMKLIKIE